MGAGASIQAEMAKPLDASDIADRDAAVAEVARLRLVLSSSVGPKQSMLQVQADTSKTCVARVQEALDRINALDGEIKACAEVLAEQAIAKAAAADAKLADGGARRALEGVPIIVKVNIDVAGTLSTASMPGFADWRPETTAPVVQKLIEAGAIVVAKTNMPEAAFGPYGFSSLHGTTLNPRNKRYSTTGSSAGTAAGIAAGMVQVGLGSDTMGSLRMPADCCAIVGLRPSRGRYPGSGIVPCNASHDTAGPMAASVADIAVLDAVITGEAPPQDYKPADLTGLCVGVDSALYAAAVPGHKNAIDLAKEVLVAAGATTKDVEFWEGVTGFQHEKQIDYRMKGLEDYIASHPNCNRTAGEVIEKSFWKGTIHAFFNLLGPFGKYSGSDLIKVNDIPESEREAAEAKFAEELKEYEAKYSKFLADNGLDFMITPTIHGPPPKQRTTEEFQDFKNIRSDFGVVVGPSSGIAALNELSIPSLAMPTKAVHEGIEGPALTAGFLLYGKPWEDKKLIEVGMALESRLN
jgi:indoleacetamide hydrolase